MNPLSIGWATTDITPEQSVFLVGQMHERKSEYVRDRLTATAFAVESMQDGCLTQAMIISCDLIAVSKTIQDRLKERLRLELPSFDPEKLFLCATHTHNGPFLNYDQGEDIFGDDIMITNRLSTEVMKPEDYCNQFIDSLTEMAIEAWTGKKPAGISPSFGYAVVGHNRRMVYQDGSSSMYGQTKDVNFKSIEGTTDHGIELLYIWDEAQELSGVIINVACPAQVLEGESFITADYWSEVRKQLEERFAKKLFVLPLIGAAGDISPHGDMIRKRKAVEADLFDIGRKITDLVEQQYPKAKSQITTDGVFNHHVERMDLPKRQIMQADFEKEIRDYSKQSSEENGRLNYTYIRNLMIKQAERQTNNIYSFELHILRLGDIAIVSNPFELFVDYGLQMKAFSRAKQTFIVQLACDCGGYLPTQKAVNGKGYSAQALNGLVGPDGGQLLVSRSVKLMNSMWKD